MGGRLERGGRGAEAFGACWVRLVGAYLTVGGGLVGEGDGELVGKYDRRLVGEYESWLVGEGVSREMRGCYLAGWVYGLLEGWNQRPWAPRAVAL